MDINSNSLSVLKPQPEESWRILSTVGTIPGTLLVTITLNRPPDCPIHSPQYHTLPPSLPPIKCHTLPPSHLSSATPCLPPSHLSSATVKDTSQTALSIGFKFHALRKQNSSEVITLCMHMQHASVSICLSVCLSAKIYCSSRLAKVTYLQLIRRQPLWFAGSTHF